jgi:hypothetical protein
MVRDMRGHKSVRTQENSDLEAAIESCPGGLNDPVVPVYYAVPVELGRTFGPKPMSCILT